MKPKILIAAMVAAVVIMVGIAIGSVYIPFVDIIRIIGYRGFGLERAEHIRPSTVAILWNLRLPRALLAFIAGGALSVSGAVMQSLLRNPLASSYTIGVSSGASLGAALVILYGITIPMLGAFTLPAVGFAFGLGTILIAISFASRIDGQMQNNTIILAGMVFSLFVNAITTLLSALNRESMTQLMLWQMGSFSMRGGWTTVYILTPIVILGIVLIFCFRREMDMMTFGEEQAAIMGVNVKRTKWILLITAAGITESTISFVGVIGFVDLVAPHVVRKIFGSSHKIVIPMSALFGGAFMVVCDLIARTIVFNELPVGAVTALLGAPFFAYIYFSRRAK